MGRIYTAIGALVALLLCLWGIHAAGAHAQALRDELKTTKDQLAISQDDLTEARKVHELDNKVTTQHLQAKAAIQTVTKEIIREVPVYIPVDTPALPGGWRLLHDAAATGETPAATSGTVAAPVEAQDAASTVAENYGACLQNAEQLERLQQWTVELSR